MRLYKRGAKWYADIQEKGKRCRKVLKASSKREAEVEGVALMQTLPRSPSSAMPLKEAIDRCYTEVWSNGKDGLRMYNRTLKIVGIIGDLPISEIDEAVVNKLAASLRDSGLSPASINRYRAYLRKVLNVAHKEWLVLPRVPLVRNTKELPTRFKVFTHAEEGAILSVCAGDMHDLVAVLVDTGMRLGESLAITPRHLDFRYDSIKLTPDITKSSRPRSIPMTQRVRTILYGRIAERGIGPDAPVFDMKMAAVEKQWLKVRKKLGGDEQWVIHTLRHTYASRLVERGVDLYTVKELLGHSAFETTTKYAHHSVDKLRAAIQTLEP